MKPNVKGCGFRLCSEAPFMKCGSEVVNELVASTTIRFALSYNKAVIITFIFKSLPLFYNYCCNFCYYILSKQRTI